ncbi:PAS domain-containing protein [Adhaeribacter aquaticus]|uniref:sensor histidine kinase n=1 Tax=Adhaeribacter aquaticus TaxID=299567 RepID=UPI000479837E|nr:PAS domain-containing protein [Adhaeribacter aquaticus]
MQIHTSLPREVLRAFESVPDLYLVFSPDLTILTVSDAYLKKTGANRFDLIGKTVREALLTLPGTMTEETITAMEESLRQVLQNKKPHQMPPQRFKFNSPEDTREEQYWRLINTPVLNEPEEVWYIIHKAEDITELMRQKSQSGTLAKTLSEEIKIRQELEATQEILKETEEIGHLGSYELDLATGLLYFSDGMFRLFGEAPRAFIPTLDFIDSRSNPEDAAEVRKILDRAAIDKQPYMYTRRIQLPDGTWRVVESHGRVLCDASGQALKFRGVVQDVTEQKTAEKQLQESKEYLQSVIDASLRAISVSQAIRDEEGQIIDFEWSMINTSTKQMWGDLVGKRYTEVFPEIRETATFKSFVQVVEEGTPLDLEVHHTYKGNINWFRLINVKLGDGLVQSAEDITVRKKVEQEILKLKDEVAQLATDKYLMLFNSIDEGFYLCEVIFDADNNPVDIFYQEENPAAVRIIRKSLVGKTLREINPDYEAFWFQIWGDVALTGKSQRLELYSNPDEKWFNFYITKVGDINSRQVAVVFNDVTEQRLTEEALRKSEQESRRLEETRKKQLEVFDTILARLQEFVYLFDREGRFQYVNKPLLDLWGLTLDQVVGKTFLELGYPDDLVKKHQEQIMRVVETGQAVEGESTYTNKDGVTQQFEYIFVPLFAADGSVEAVGGRTQGVTERKQAEEALRKSEERFRLFVTASSDTIYKASPDWKELYSLVGKGIVLDAEEPTPNWIERYIPEEDRPVVLHAIRKAIQTKDIYELEHRVYRLDGSIGWIFSRAIPVLNEQGEIIEWFGAASDISLRKSAEQQLKEFNALLEEQVAERTFALKQRNEQFEAAINVSPVALGVVKSMRNSQKQIVDFAIDWVSKIGEVMAGRSLLGLPLTERFPYVRKTGLLQKFIRTVETGEATEYAYNLREMEINKWFRWRAVKFYDGLFISVEDITETKKTEEALKEEHRRLKESQAIGHIGTFEWNPVTDDIYWSDEMFRIHGLEPQCEKVTLDLVYSYVHPDDVVFVKRRFSNARKQAGSYEITHRIVRSDGEIRYILRRYEARADQHAQFMYLTGTAQDITDLKKYEQNILKHLTLLKQSEEVVGMGSWEYDINTGAIHWSEGMYRLYGLPTGSPVNLTTYLEHVIEEDLPLVQRLINTIRSKPAPLEETMRIKVDQEIITLKIKAIVLRDELGKPIKVLGIDLDVSEVKRLEEENLQMRLNQQKALLIAILDAQEEERRRISESLHNGVGQILYATKLNLDRVERQMPKGPEAQRQVLQTTQSLLEDAINETRRVSHELVPVILKDFGLEKSVQELCRVYDQSAIRFYCEVDGFETRPEPYLEVAIYRICQELVNNIVKHSDASEANILLYQEENEITLKVRDNGKGIHGEPVQNKGIGIRSISDRVKLLNGTFAISIPNTGRGTLVTIIIPVTG